MVALPRRLFILALAVATLALVLVVTPVSATRDDYALSASKGQLASAHSKVGTFNHIRSITPTSIQLPTFNHEALSLANTYGAHLVERHGKTVYFQSVIPRGSTLHRTLLTTHPDVKDGTVVLLWKHAGGDQYHLVSADLIKATKFDWNSYLTGLRNVVKV